MFKSGMILALVLGFAANTAFAAQSEYVPGEVIVKFKPGFMATRQMMDQLYDAAGVRTIERFSGIEKLTLEPNVRVRDAIATFEQSPIVQYAQPNYILRILPYHPIQAANANSGIPCIPGMQIPGCDPNGIPSGVPSNIPGGGGGGGIPGIGGSIPCIPGLQIPGCDPNACIPGTQYPPGCHSGGSPTPAPSNPAPAPAPNPPDNPSPTRPPLQAAPPAVNPPVADPDLSMDYGLQKIGAVQAWKIWKGSRKMIVADIDTGIDYNHEDLAYNLWRNPHPGPQNDIVGYDFVHNDGLPYDDNGHGTHTAGTIGAVGGNGVGTSGVAQRVSIMALKFLSGDGSGETTGAIKAIDYAIAHGAKILSNSWGGPADPGNQALLDAINRANSKGVLFVAAAGNGDEFGNPQDDDNPSTASYPAAFTTDNMIAVAATDETDDLAFFSNYGAKTVHLAAPGVNIYSTLPGNKYGKDSGTSMACPHVAGAAALLWSYHPDWNYKKVKQVLMDTTDKIDSLKGKTISGGRLDVLNALRSTE